MKSKRMEIALWKTLTRRRQERFGSIITRFEY